MTICRWLALGFLFIARASAEQYLLNSTSSCGRYYGEIDSLDAERGAFLEQARARAHMFLDSTGKGFAVRTLTIVEASALKRPRRRASQQSYSDWRASYLSPDRVIRARVVTIRDSASLQFNDGLGNLTDMPLFGTDPSHGRIGEIEFEIMGFSFWSTSTSRSAEDRQKSDCAGEAFVRTQATLDNETAPKIAREVLDKLSAWTKVVVFIRNDDWFYGFGSVLHPLSDATAQPPKAKADFDKLPQYNCFAGEVPEVHCQGFGEKTTSRSP